MLLFNSVKLPTTRKVAEGGGGKRKSSLDLTLLRFCRSLILHVNFATKVLLCRAALAIAVGECSTRQGSVTVAHACGESSLFPHSKDETHETLSRLNGAG
jgi:hypothetical protein